MTTTTTTMTTDSAGEVKLSRLARLVALDDRLLRRLVRNRRARTAFALRLLCRLYDPDMVVLAIAVVLLVAFWVAYYRSRQRDSRENSSADASGTTSGNAPADTATHCAHGSHDVCAADGDGGAAGGDGGD